MVIIDEFTRECLTLHVARRISKIIKTKLLILARNPAALKNNIRRLSGPEEALYHFRIGAYRVIFKKDETNPSAFSLASRMSSRKTRKCLFSDINDLSQDPTAYPWLERGFHYEVDRAA